MKHPIRSVGVFQTADDGCFNLLSISIVWEFTGNGSVWQISFTMYPTDMHVRFTALFVFSLGKHGMFTSSRECCQMHLHFHIYMKLEFSVM